MVSQGAIPKLVALLSSPHLNIGEQAVWALGNIAGDGPKCRDLVLQAGTMEHLLKLIFDKNIGVSLIISFGLHDILFIKLFQLTFLRNIVWTLSNLCRNKNPAPSFASIKPCMPALSKLLSYSDKDVLGNLCLVYNFTSFFFHSEMNLICNGSYKSLFQNRSKKNVDLRFYKCFIININI